MVRALPAVLVSIAVFVIVLRLYFVFRQWQVLASRESEVAGVDAGKWSTVSGVTLFSPDKSNSIAAAKNGWCTNCGDTAAGQAPCASGNEGFCYGQTDDDFTVSADRSVPRALPQTVASAADCAAACESGDCDAWEYDPRLGKCFTYLVSQYPPQTPDTSSPENVVGWRVGSVNQAVLRETAGIVLLLVPLALVYGAYRVRTQPLAPRQTALVWVLPLVVGIVAASVLSFVGFADTVPETGRSCNAQMGERCFADALTGGRRSGSCYNTCCARTISCPVTYYGIKGYPDAKNVWSTCTWPNVMCKDGSCAESEAACNGTKEIVRGIDSKGQPNVITIDHGGVMKDMTSCTRSVGGTPANAADYGGSFCNAKDTITQYDLASLPAFQQKAGDGQYPGQQNKKPSAKALSETGLRVLPPGRTDNFVDDRGVIAYNTFSLTPNTNTFLGGTSTTPDAKVTGCGMATDPRTETQALFLRPAPAPLQCTVATAPSKQ